MVNHVASGKEQWEDAVTDLTNFTKNFAIFKPIPFYESFIFIKFLILYMSIYRQFLTYIDLYLHKVNFS